MSKKAAIRRLQTGVPGLDHLLGGGLPEYSLNLIAGTPGSGKTTLAHQIMFALATPQTKALYFSVLGEPPLKMLRYQQQFGYFNPAKLNKTIYFFNLSDQVIKGDFDAVLECIVAEVKKHAPGLVFVDSIRSVVKVAVQFGTQGTKLQHFIQQLGLVMTSWQATTFLIGEYSIPESDASSIFTVADGVIYLSQSLHRNSVVRKIQVIKMRGQAQASGLHTLRIRDSGIQVFPRAIVTDRSNQQGLTEVAAPESRMSLGVAGLDAMLNGGLPRGYSLLVVGPSGSGKTVLATSFLAEGVRQGEPGVMAVFEKNPYQIQGNLSLSSLIRSGQVGVIQSRSLELSLDEVLYDLTEMIQSLKAKRVVIDSLSGFELSLAPEFSEDFRGSLYRMVAELTAMGMTILMTSELEDRYMDLRFSPFGSAFMADAILVQRYVELEGELKRVTSVIKVRGSAHSKEIRLYDISDQGMQIGKALTEYGGIMTGRPTSSRVVNQPRQ